MSSLKNHGAFMSTTSNTPQTDETSEQFSLMRSPIVTYSLEDFRVQLFRLLDEEQDSAQKIHEVHSFLKSAESSVVKESHMYSLRMLRGSSTMTEDELLESSSPAWMNWGMTSNGNVLTARISESHRIGNEYSLSEILEENPDQKYFLSEDAMQRMVYKTEKNKALKRGFKPQIVKNLQSEPYATDFTKEILTTSTLKTEFQDKLNAMDQTMETQVTPQMDLFEQPTGDGTTSET
jgi:hypothetical protein